MSFRVALVFLGTTLLLTASCGKSQLDGKPTAKVEDSTGEAKALEPAQPTGDAPAKPAVKSDKAPEPANADKAAAPEASRRLLLDPRQSSIGFVGKKITGDHEGSFSDISGTAEVRNYTLLSLDARVEMGSLTADHPDLTNHLKSPDFFNSSKYPTVRFNSKSLRSGSEGTASHTISGELSLLAVTKRISFPATIVITDTGATGVAEFKINRKDFGIVYPGKPDDLIADEVLLKLNLAFVKAP